MASFVIDLSGRGGLAPKHYGDRTDSASSPHRRYLGGDSQYADGFCSPLRNYGYMSPTNNSFTGTTTSDAFTGVFTARAYNDSQNDVIFVEEGPYIYKLDGLADTSFSAQITSGQKVTGSKFTDIKLYQLNGVAAYYAAYYTTGGADVAMTNDLSNFSGSYDNDWLSTVPTGAFSLVSGDVQLRVADNGFMYILNKNKVHKLDGTTDGGASGTATANVLVFPPSYILRDGLDYRSNMYFAIREKSTSGVGGKYFGRCGVYIWNRVSTVTSLSDYIPIQAKDIHRIYATPSGRVRVIVTSNDDVTEIREFNGSAFVTIADIGSGAHPEFVDGLDQVGELSVWMGANGVMYAHGKPAVGEPEGLFKIGDIDGNSTLFTKAGAIFYGDDTDEAVYLSYNDNGTITNKKWYPFGTGSLDSVVQLNHIGNFYSLVKPMPKLSNLQRVTIMCIPSVNSDTTEVGTVKIYTNNGTTPVKTKTLTRAMTAKGYVPIEINAQFVNSIQIEIEWENENQTAGENDLRVSYAIVEYEPTATAR